MDAIGAVCGSVWRISTKLLPLTWAMSRRRVGPCDGSNSKHQVHGVMENDKNSEIADDQNVS